MKVKTNTQRETKTTVFQNIAHWILLSIFSLSLGFSDMPQHSPQSSSAVILEQLLVCFRTEHLYPIKWWKRQRWHLQFRNECKLQWTKLSTCIFHTDHTGRLHRLEYFSAPRNCSNNLSAGRCTYDSWYGKRVSYHLFHIYSSLVHVKGNGKLQGHYAFNWRFYKVR